MADPLAQSAPGGQKAQADRLVAPGTAENMDAGQGVGADPARQYDPAGHGTVPDAAPPAHAKPAAQARHVEAAEAPVAAEYVPAAQATGPAPAAHQKPAAQATVADEEPGAHDFPAAHATHAEAALWPVEADAVPAGHSTGAAPAGQYLLVRVVGAGEGEGGHSRVVSDKACMRACK